MALHFKHTKKLFLLDQDGTLYKGAKLFASTPAFLKKIKESGASYLFITNNSSKTNEEYVAKLAKLGIKAQLNEFYTSADATIEYLKKHHPGAYVYLVGTKSLVALFAREGILLSDDISRVSVAVLSYDTELNYTKLETITRLLRNPHVTYLATNPDLVCPTEDGYLPDCGSFAIMLYNATGRNPLFLGKPRALFAQTILEKYGLNNEDVVVVGDRLYTDIALGVNTGIDSILVLSGEATRKDLETAAVTPTFVVDSIADIFD